MLKLNTLLEDETAGKILLAINRGIYDSPTISNEIKCKRSRVNKYLSILTKNGFLIKDGPNCLLLNTKNLVKIIGDSRNQQTFEEYFTFISGFRLYKNITIKEIVKGYKMFLTQNCNRHRSAECKSQLSVFLKWLYA